MIIVVRLLGLLSVVLFQSSSYAQPVYQVQGQLKGDYKKMTAQGMAIWGDKAYLLNNPGWCRIYDFGRGMVICSFPLASLDENNHANNASFGFEKVGGSNMPGLYVSEYRKPYRCFVEKVEEGKSSLIQTITSDCRGDNAVNQDWVVDRKSRKLYSISKLEVIKEGNKTTRRHHIVRYRLPSLSEGANVVLLEKDMEDAFDVYFPNIFQGATIRGRYMYVSAGLQDGHEQRWDAKRALIVIDLKQKRIKHIMDLTDITEGREPEGLDFNGRQLLLFCGQKGGIYRIK